MIGAELHPYTASPVDCARKKRAHARAGSPRPDVVARTRIEPVKIEVGLAVLGVRGHAHEVLGPRSQTRCRASLSCISVATSSWVKTGQDQSGMRAGLELAQPGLRGVLDEQYRNNLRLCVYKDRL